MQGRIYFPGNPWPEGHAIQRLAWTGRLDPEFGLLFELHLETAKYDEERQAPDREGQGDYASPLVWGNHHACKLDGVWVAGTEDEPLRFDALSGQVQRVDALDDEEVDFGDLDDRRFGLYLLGHDDVADHRLTFTRRGSTWDFLWQARIALAYSGDYEFRHTLRAEVSGLAFEHVVIPHSLGDAAAETLLAQCCADAARFARAADDGPRRFVPKTV